MTITTARPSPRYLEPAGRMALAATSLLIGLATAASYLPGTGTLLAAWALLATAWAVAWPEHAADALWAGADRHAARAAGLVLCGSAASAALVGSPVTFAVWTAGIAGAMASLSLLGSWLERAR